jgi:sugar/nucleoside kinase (ribokinase family)
MKFDVVTIGGAVFDLFIRPEKESILRVDTKRGSHAFLAFPHGEKLEIGEIHREFGGGASNVAVNVSVMGLKSAIVARVGGDYYGKEIIKNLKKNKVAIDGIDLTRNEKSGFSIIINSYDGERTVLYCRGVNNSTPKKAITKLAGSGKWIHITSLPSDSDNLFKLIVGLKKKRKSLKVSWNPGAHQLKNGYAHYKNFLKNVDVLMLNREELELFSHMKSHRYNKATQKKIMDTCHEQMISQESDSLSYVYDICKSAKKILSLGVKTVVVTDGRRGAQLFEKDNHFYIPCGENSPVATLGAGDAFCSGFIAGILYSGESRTALQYATLNAGSVVSKFGAQKGIMKKKELEKGLGKLPILKLG